MDAVLELVDEVGIGPDRLLFSSSRQDWLKTVARLRPQFTVQVVLGLFHEDPMDFSDPLFDTYNPRLSRLSLAEVTELLRSGTRLNPFTVNEPEMMSRLIELGVDGLITDFPQRVPK